MLCRLTMDDGKAGGSTWGEFSKEESAAVSGSSSSSLPRKNNKSRLPKGKVLYELPRTNQSEDVFVNRAPIIPKEEDEGSVTDSSEELSDALPEAALARAKIISHISRIRAGLFFKSQQQGDPRLSRKEKKQIAASLLDSNPGSFLSRYGRCLEPSHMQYFHQFRDSSYEVNYHLQQLEKSAASRVKLVRNRRYQAMQELISKGEYFSLSEMRSRNPLLFDHLVGNYMTSEEKEEVTPAETTCDLSTILMAHMERDGESSVRRKEQEAEAMAWNEGEEQASDTDEEPEELDDEERELLMAEFVSSMHNSFLDGKDRDFDYSTVDDNPQYDDPVLCDRDAEDRYFDSD